MKQKFERIAPPLLSADVPRPPREIGLRFIMRGSSAGSKTRCIDKRLAQPLIRGKKRAI